VIGAAMQEAPCSTPGVQSRRHVAPLHSRPRPRLPSARRVAHVIARLSAAAAVLVILALVAGAVVPATAQDTLRVTYEVDRTTRPGQARLNGRVVNEGSADAVEVSVHAEALNAAGHIVGRGISYVDARIGRGDSRTFLVIVPNAAAAERFRVTATAMRGFMPQGP
jgi:hypothetical protein